VSTPREGRFAQAAYAEEPVEAEMIQGLLEGAGIPSVLQSAGLNSGRLVTGSARPGYAHGPQRIMVHEEQAEQARAVVARALADNADEAWPEIANARHLEAASGGRRGPRSYGAPGAFARIYLSAFGFFAVAFGVFLLFRGG
jgi:Putative prokaryotic signal transducing protein